MKDTNMLPVVIIGGGPVGLAAAAQLVSRTQAFLLFEAGDSVAANVLSWKHVRVFSPWRYNIDRAAKKLLQNTSWVEPDENALPTGQELFDQYLEPLASLNEIKDHLHLNARVISVGRKNMDKMRTAGREKNPFIVQVLQQGEVRRYEAKAVIDASGTWSSPNPVGAGGVYAEGEFQNHDRIQYGIPDFSKKDKLRYANKRIAVVGGGHSAINTILELNNLRTEYPDTEIHWVMRKKNISDIFGGQEKDALEARGSLGIRIEQLIREERVNVYTPFQIQEIVEADGYLNLIGYQGDNEVILPAIDQIISNTGARPDFSFLREVRLAIDPALESVSQIADLIDPNIHSCGTVRPHGEKELRHPDKDFYIVGAKSYGRAPTFLMATGYEQVRSIVAAIDGDYEAAMNVELDLPETGVCSVDIGGGECCGVSSSKEERAPEAICCG